jgi:FKBP-type peptidyl-prolyl cis-trans isomerase
MEKQQGEAKKKGDENMKKGQEFLAQNGKKAGVKTTASGLQYEVIKEGTGKQPTAENTVTVHYTGTLINGKKFDSSVDRGEPATFPLKGVIAGWTEGLQLMKIGAKYRFYIPSNLGYGERGAGADIGPNETLIFDVELIDVK